MLYYNLYRLIVCSKSGCISFPDSFLAHDAKKHLPTFNRLPTKTSTDRAIEPEPALTMTNIKATISNGIFRNDDHIQDR